MFQMYMYCLQQVNISVVSLDFIYNTSQFASFLLLNLHSLPFRHNRALIAQIIIIQNIMLPENASCPRFLNFFVNFPIYSNLLIVSVLHGQLTLHCTGEQPSRACTTWVPWFTEFLSSEHTTLSGVGWKCKGIGKAPTATLSSDRSLLLQKSVDQGCKTTRKLFNFL